MRREGQRSAWIVGGCAPRARAMTHLGVVVVGGGLDDSLGSLDRVTGRELKDRHGRHISIVHPL